VTVDMVSKLTKILNDANSDERVKFIIFKGSGGNFSSGNDFNNFMLFNSMGETVNDIVKISTDLLYDLTTAVIYSKKPLFAIAEGKAIGFGFTQLLLYDRVFAVEGGEFSAPLVKSAQGPEMCCSFTFPKRFGQSIGEHLIISGDKVDAAFLEKHGVVTVCKSPLEAQKRLEEHLSELDELKWPSYQAARELFRAVDRPTLDEVSKQ
jgi:enoyl-CoA hydratase/carnithine racemase